MMFIDDKPVNALTQAARRRTIIKQLNASNSRQYATNHTTTTTIPPTSSHHHHNIPPPPPLNPRTGSVILLQSSKPIGNIEKYNSKPLVIVPPNKEEMNDSHDNMDLFQKNSHISMSSTTQTASSAHGGDLERNSDVASIKADTTTDYPHDSDDDDSNNDTDYRGVLSRTNNNNISIAKPAWMMMIALEAEKASSTGDVAGDDHKALLSVIEWYIVTVDVIQIIVLMMIMMMIRRC